MAQVAAVLVQQEDAPEQPRCGQPLDLAHDRFQRQAGRSLLHGEFQDAVLCCTERRRPIARLRQARVLDGDGRQATQAFQTFDGRLIVLDDIGPIGPERRDRRRPTDRDHDETAHEGSRIGLLRNAWIKPDVADQDRLAVAHRPARDAGISRERLALP